MIVGYAREKQPSKGNTLLLAYASKCIGEKEAASDYYSKLGAIYMIEASQTGIEKDSDPRRKARLICCYATTILEDIQNERKTGSKSWLYQSALPTKKELAQKCIEKSNRLKRKAKRKRFEFENQVKRIAQTSSQDNQPICYISCKGIALSKPERLPSIEKWIKKTLIPDLELSGIQASFLEDRKSRVAKQDDSDYFLLHCTDQAENSKFKNTDSNRTLFLLIDDQESSKKGHYNLGKNYFVEFLKLCTKLKGMVDPTYIQNFKYETGKKIDSDYEEKIAKWDKNRKVQNQTMGPLSD